MNKICTTIEQSKKLIELGIDINTADMDYVPYVNDITEYDCIVNIWNNEHEEDWTPCWSLAALLEAMPQSITKYIESERCQRTYHINLFRSYYYCVSYSFTPSVEDDNTLFCIGEDNWVDACYKMILKLHELKML